MTGSPGSLRPSALYCQNVIGNPYLSRFLLQLERANSASYAACYLSGANSLPPDITESLPFYLPHLISPHLKFWLNVPRCTDHLDIPCASVDYLHLFPQGQNRAVSINSTLNWVVFFFFFFKPECYSLRDLWDAPGKPIAVRGGVQLVVKSLSLGYRLPQLKTQSATSNGMNCKFLKQCVTQCPHL